MNEQVKSYTKDATYLVSDRLIARLMETGTDPLELIAQLNIRLLEYYCEVVKFDEFNKDGANKTHILENAFTAVSIKSNQAFEEYLIKRIKNK